jgi:hypothetical protein
MSFLLEVADVFNGIVQGVASALQAVSKPLADLAASFDATKVLTVIADAVRWFADKVSEAVTWVMEHIGPFFDTIVGFFKDLWSWLKPILDVLLKVISLANPVGIVMLLGSWIWLKIPKCIKDPIIHFVLGLLIRIVDALPDVSLFGPLWTLFKYGALGFLKKLQGTEKDPDKAEAALDRIARLVGGTADFVLGLVVGILEGLWDGLIGPFQLVYMLIEGVVGIIDFFEKLQKDFQDEVKSIIGTAKGIGTTIEQEFWPTIKGLLSGEGGGGGSPMDTVLGLFKKVWDAVTGAATEVGVSIASALIGFIMLGDYELGSKLGYVGGLVLFEVILAILTAGVSAELKFFESGIGWVLKMLVKVNEAIGEVFGAIMKMIPGLEGAIARLIETLGELPILKNLGKEFSRMFGQVEELALAGMRRFGGEAVGESGALGAKAATRGTGEAAKTLGTADTRAATADARAASTDARTAADADAKAASHAETPATREAAVDESGKLESRALTDAELEQELEYIGDHPEMITGEPPKRRAQISKDHAWEEQPSGGWCRHSADERCFIKPPETLKPPAPTTNPVKSLRDEFADVIDAADPTFQKKFRDLAKRSMKGPVSDAEVAAMRAELEDARLALTIETKAPHKIEELDRIRTLELQGKTAEAEAARQQLKTDLRRLEGGDMPTAANLENTTGAQRSAEVKKPGGEIPAEGSAPTAETTGAEGKASARTEEGREFGEKGFVDRASHDIGVKEGTDRAIKDGLKQEPWVNPRGHIGGYGQGFDDIMRDTATGKLVIVEFKGGAADLANAQMSRSWVEKRIAQIRDANPKLAAELQAALDAGDLTGRVYRTSVQDGKAVSTTMDPVIKYAKK